MSKSEPEFDRFATSFKEKPLANLSDWVLDGGQLSKNGRVIVDLRTVDKISLGYMTFRGSTMKRLALECCGTSVVVKMDAGFSQKHEKKFDQLQRIVLHQFAEYQPDGIVDPSGVSTVKWMNRLIGVTFTGAGFVFVYAALFPIQNGSDIARMPLWLIALLAAVFLIIGVSYVAKTRGAPQSAREYARSTD